MIYGNDVTAKGTPNYTGQGWAGDRYQDGLSTKDIAARIRKTVNDNWPRKKGYRISVIYQSFSGGSSIDIRIKAAPFKIYNPAFDGNNWKNQYTPELNELKDVLKDLAQSYRYSDSDGMIDYFNTNFYSDVQVWWEVDKKS
jgi:hypothetical protein